MKIKKTIEIEGLGLGEKIANAKAASGLTVKAICKRADISRETFYAIVNETQSVLLFETLEMLCLALGVTPATLGIVLTHDLQHPNTAPLGEPVLGCFGCDDWQTTIKEHDPDSESNEVWRWRNPDGGMFIDGPDGWIPLPVMEEVTP